MTGLFTFEWERDLEGYEIGQTDYGDRAIVPKSHNPEVYQFFEIGAGKYVPFQMFADTQLTPEGYLSFANKFGLLFSRGDEEPLHAWNIEIKNMRQAIAAWQQRDFDSIIDIFKNMRFGQVSLVMERGQAIGDRPQLRVHAVDLSNALWIQFAEAVSADLKIRRCNFQPCGTPFAYGPGTGRRSTVTYCSPKCQKAHTYQKRKEAQK